MNFSEIIKRLRPRYAAPALPGYNSHRLQCGKHSLNSTISQTPVLIFPQHQSCLTARNKHFQEVLPGQVWGLTSPLISPVTLVTCKFKMKRKNVYAKELKTSSYTILIPRLPYNSLTRNKPNLISKVPKDEEATSSWGRVTTSSPTVLTLPWQFGSELSWLTWLPKLRRCL